MHLISKFQIYCAKIYKCCSLLIFWHLTEWLSNDNFFTADRCHYQFLCVFRWNVELLKEVHEYFCYFSWVVFLDGVTNVFNNHHLKFTLHLSYRKLFVHSVWSCKKQLLWEPEAQELLSQIFEPPCPVRLCCHQVCSPSVVFQLCDGVSLLLYLPWHRYSSRSKVSYLVALDPILDNRLETLELLWSFKDNVLHEWQSVHRWPLYHINYKRSHDMLCPLFVLECVLNLVSCLHCYRSSHWMSN